MATSQNVRALVNRLLDSSYNRAATLVVQAIEGATQNPRMKGLLDLIESEAAKGVVITPDHPTVRLLRAELQDQLGAIRPLLNNAAYLIDIVLVIL